MWFIQGTVTIRIQPIFALDMISNRSVSYAMVRKLVKSITVWIVDQVSYMEKRIVASRLKASILNIPVYQVGEKRTWFLVNISLMLSTWKIFTRVFYRVLIFVHYNQLMKFVKVLFILRTIRMAFSMMRLVRKRFQHQTLIIGKHVIKNIKKNFV